MGLATVYIEREPLLNMVMAAVEMYNRECLGYLFGRKIELKGEDRYVITNAVHLAGMVSRTNGIIEQSQRAYDRLKTFIKATPKLYPYIGDFHSHPALGRYKPPSKLSESDRRNMTDREHEFSLLITIAKRGKQLYDWRVKAKGTRLRGTIADFNIHIIVYQVQRGDDDKVVRDERKVPIVYRLPISVAPATLKVLNRAQQRRKSD